MSNPKKQRFDELFHRALACPECGQLCAIGQSGVVCLEGHGKIRGYSQLLKEFDLSRFFSARVHKRLGKMEHVERQYAEIAEAEKLLRRERPNLIVEPRTNSEIAPPSPAASRTQPIQKRVGEYEFKIRERIWNKSYGDEGEQPEKDA